LRNIIIILTAFCLISCSSALNLNAPSLAFVDTEIANIVSDKEGVRYMMRYKLADDSPDNLYVRIHYQDLTNNKVFHTTSIGSISDVKLINYYSPRSLQIINKHYFKITLILYKDSSYSQSLGIHTDLVFFDMPETVAEMLNIQLLR